MMGNKLKNLQIEISSQSMENNELRECVRKLDKDINTLKNKLQEREQEI